MINFLNPEYIFLIKVDELYSRFLGLTKFFKAYSTSFGYLLYFAPWKVTIDAISTIFLSSLAGNRAYFFQSKSTIEEQVYTMATINFPSN